MRRISPMDAMFLDIETPATPSAIAGFFILDPSDLDGGRVSHPDILRYVEDRLHLSPSLRQRLVFDPLGVDEPMMIDDENFDLEFHIRHIGVPHPRDMRQLNILAARIFSRPMDLNRPLWEMYIIEGLDNLDGYPEGCFAILFKLHHTAFDGVSAGSTIFSMLQRSPNETVKPPLKRWVPERPPNAFERSADLVTTRLKKNVSNVVKAPRLVSGAVKGLRKEIKAEGETTPSVPETRFQGDVSSHRVCDWMTIPMPELHAARKRLGGVKVNDMAVGIVAGGLRRYLLERDELPEEDMICLCPINTRGKGNPMEGGNQVSMMRLPMGVLEADPVARLQLIGEGTARGKALQNTVGASFSGDVMSIFPYPVRAAAMKAGARALRSGWINPPGNTVVSNVPNPLGDYFFAGAKLTSYTGFGPVYDGQGLFHTITSIESQLSISATSCREMLPDVEEYMDMIRASADEILNAGKPKTRARAKPAAKKAPTKKAAATRKRKAASKSS